MPMTDMKQSAAETKETMPMAMDSAAKDQYPWGLRIRLGEPELKKLGLDTLPKVGGVMTLTAEVKIIGTHEDANETNKNRSVELQITKMDFGEEDAEASFPEKAVALYPNQGK
jgi:hypothetical protein